MSNSLLRAGKKVVKKQIREVLEAKSAGAREPWYTLRRLQQKLERGQEKNK